MSIVFLLGCEVVEPLKIDFFLLLSKTHPMF